LICDPKGKDFLGKSFPFFKFSTAGMERRYVVCIQIMGAGAAHGSVHPQLLSDRILRDIQW
jgi:hypothetical protein